uniref:hypothetical protein n=1 Tax=Aeromicrobium sp. REDSEA-S32_B7 TaxID=1811526 RepID=UPI000A501F09
MADSPGDQSTNTFDIVILGGGSGGYACALRAVQLGLSVEEAAYGILEIAAFTMAGAVREVSV